MRELTAPVTSLDLRTAGGRLCERLPEPFGLLTRGEGLPPPAPPILRDPRSTDLHVAVTLGLVILAGCSDSSAVIDRFPVNVDVSTGVPVLQATWDDGAGNAAVALDTGSHITVLPGTDPVTRRRLDLTLLDAVAGVPRARFISARPLFGAVAAPLGAVGGDLLTRVAVRFDLTAAEPVVTFFQGITGSADLLSESCEAVLQTPIRGGGAFVEPGGAGVATYPATRVVMGTCLPATKTATGELDPGVAAASSGRNALLVLATGVNEVVLGESAYRRFFPDRIAPEVPLPFGEPLLVAGALEPVLAYRDPDGIAGLGLVGYGDGGPCEKLAQSRAVARNETRTFRSLASLEIAEPLPLVVVPDSCDLLQSIRQELRPAVAEIDGLLGASALLALRGPPTTVASDAGPVAVPSPGIAVDVDYPSARVIFHCADASSDAFVCRPQVLSEAQRADLCARCDFCGVP